jgi:predicted small lipoprotein YifL
MKTIRILPLFLLLLLALCGCGKKGPLVAPESLRFPPIGDLAAQQRGGAVLLSWSNPYGPRVGVTVFRLYRREVLPPGQDCEECTDAYRLTRSVDLEMPNGVSRDNGRFVVSDAEVLADKTYQYRLHAILSDGTTAAISNPARVVLRPLPAPPRLTAEATPVSVLLNWEPLPVPAGVKTVRYQVFRRQGDDPWTMTPLTAKPLPVTRYEDFPPLTGATWHYVVRGLLTYEGAQAETDASAVATVTLPPPGL